jgi:uncharacterized protein YjdB
MDTTARSRTLRALVCLTLGFAGAGCGNREHSTAPSFAALVLTARAAGINAIDLTWQVPVDVDASKGTRVFRDDVLVGISFAATWTDHGLTSGTVYHYRVTSIGASGRESAISNIASALTSVPKAIRLTVSPTAAAIDVGDGLRLVATVRDSATGEAVSGYQVAWASANVAVATAASDGTATGVTPGTVAITASSEGITATAQITVRPRSAVSVTVTPGQSSIQATKSATLTAIARDAAGNVLSGRTFAWASTDPSVATVSPSGVVTGVTAGSVTIAATTDGVTGTASVNIVANGGNTDPDVASLTLTPSTLALSPGANGQVNATLRDANGNVLTGKVIAWSTGNSAVATVSQSGLVSALANGSASITASSGGLSASAAVTVATSGGGGSGPAVATVSVTPSTSTIGTGATVQLTATTRDAGGNTLTGRSIVWSSSNTGVATVSGSGLVTSVAAGSAVVTATSEGVSGSATVTVTAAPPTPVASVTITPPSVSITVGATAQLTATTKDAQGNTLTGRVVTWSSSNGTVATVSGSGLVTGVGVGAAVITATSEGVSSGVTVTVSPKPVVSVTITPSSGSVCVGAALQLTATPRDIDGNPLTGRVVVWSTSSGALATVSSTGLVLGVAIGSVTITATVEGVSSSVTLAVCAPIVATVTVSAPSSTLSLAGSLLMSAVAKDAYGNVILGRPVTWSVSPSSRALISAAGLLTPLTVGSVTVTATIDGVSGSTSVSIVP